MNLKSLALAATAASSLLAPLAQAQTEIQFWHSMTAVNNEWVNDLAKEFNASQKDFKIVPTFKGSYDESMTAAVAAFRSGNAPHILQVFEVGTATMMASKGVVVPVGKMMTDAGYKFDPSAYVPAVAGLLHRAQRADAELPVQQLDDSLLHQPRRLQGGRTGPRQAADHLARGGPRRGDAEDQWPQVPVHHCLAGLDAAGELLHLAQHRAGHEAQRAGRHGRTPDRELAAAHAPHREPGQYGQAGPVHLQGPRQRARGQLRIGRVRDDHHVFGLLRQRQAQRQVRLRAGHAALLPRRARAPRRTLSSAAPACG